MSSAVESIHTIELFYLQALVQYPEEDFQIGFGLDETFRLERKKNERIKMDLQRRGHQTSLSNNQNKARLYWRCYFNAVTCF
ncbi:hypothetical protein ABEB36_009203 [Hypothenemus hampei]|uniref:Uncharacterized protein n=1 Tax=Hypothenemus hampei TaxID=57062 RepID=A0ABD1EPY0_HYPHA